MVDSTMQTEDRTRGVAGGKDGHGAVGTRAMAEPGATAQAADFLRAGRPKDAVKLLEKVGEGRSFEQILLLARAHFESFEVRLAEATLTKARSVGDISDHLDAQLLCGEIAYDAGRTDEARRYLHRVRELSPINQRAVELLRQLGEDVADPQGGGLEPAPSSPGLTPGGAPAERPSRFLLQVAVTLVVGVTFLGVYGWSSKRSHTAKLLVLEAQPLAAVGDVKSLRAAEQKYREVLEIKGNSEYALAGLSEIYTQLWLDHGMLGEKDKATEFVQRAIKKDAQKAERYAAEMLLAYGEGRAADAERIAEDVVKRGGVSDKLYFAVGLVEAGLGKYKLARENLRRAQELNSNSAMFAAALGDAMDMEGDTRNSAYYWAVAAKNNNAYILGVARDLMGRARTVEPAARIEAELNRLSGLPDDELGPRDRSAIELAKAELAYRDGALKSAGEYSERALQLDPRSPLVLAMRGRVLLAAGKVDEGTSALKNAVDASHAAPRYVYMLGRAYADNKKADQAVAFVSGEKPRLAAEPAFQVVLGDVLRQAGDIEGARKAYTTALEVFKGYPDALLGLGKLEAGTKQFDKAREWYEQAVAVMPNFPEVYEAVGLMWIIQGAHKEAGTQLEQAERLYQMAGVDAFRMRKFYDTVSGAYTASKQGSFARAWEAKAKALAAKGA